MDLVENICKYVKNEGVLALKKRHAYYNQVIFGMALLNIPKCDFLIYSSLSKNYIVIEVNFNPVKVVDLLKRVTNNDFKFILHVYCENKNKIN